MQRDGAVVAQLATGTRIQCPSPMRTTASASRSHSSLARRPVRASTSTTRPSRGSAAARAAARSASSRVSTRRSPRAKQCRSSPRSPEAEGPSVMWRVVFGVGGISGRPLDIGGGRVAAVHGDGPSAVVLVNQIEDAPCRWTEFAARVADGGRRVVLWSYGTRDLAERQAAVTAAIDATRADGAEHVVLIGASIGAGYALESAAAANPPIDGVIALSPGAEPGERARQVSGLGSLTAAVLAVASKSDAGSTPAVAQSLLDAAASADEGLLALAGGTHGIALVTGPTAAEVLPSVEAFLAAHAPA